jgi:hypothetical protein
MGRLHHKNAIVTGAAGYALTFLIHCCITLVKGSLGDFLDFVRYCYSRDFRHSGANLNGLGIAFVDNPKAMS